jgi:hypothetical protein
MPNRPARRTTHLSVRRAMRTFCLLLSLALLAGCHRTVDDYVFSLPPSPLECAGKAVVIVEPRWAVEDRHGGQITFGNTIWRAGSGFPVPYIETCGYTIEWHYLDQPYIPIPEGLR